MSRNDDLSDDELEKAAEPLYSSRFVVDDWCRRLVAEVRRRRREEAREDRPKTS